MSLKLTFFRWFHDGCCQCVGSPCQARAENQFGIDQSRWEDLEKGGNGTVLFWVSNNNFSNRCEECPLLEDEDDISDEEMELMVR